MCKYIYCKNKEIFTPKVEDGLLDGIIRKRIIEEFKVQERSISLEELKESDEVILTNSLMGAMSVKKIDGINYDGEEFRKIFNEKLN